MLDWDDLRTFLAIARQGSLSGAARVLGVQQTTVGRRLAGLEARAGAMLLQKTPRGYVTTSAGDAILGNVERIEGEALAIERRITGRDVRLEGTVRVTMVESLAADLVVPALPSFHARHPGIALDIAAEARSLSLTMREAEVAVRLARLEQQDLAVRKLGTLTFGLYASEAYLAAHGMPDFAAGAPGHAVVANQAEFGHLPEVSFLARVAREGRVVLRSNSRYVQREAARAGLGIACLARYLGDAGGLVLLEAPESVTPREIWLAVHNDIRHTPRIRAVTDFLAATLRAAAPTLAPT